LRQSQVRLANNDWQDGIGSNIGCKSIDFNELYGRDDCKAHTNGKCQGNC